MDKIMIKAAELSVISLFSIPCIVLIEHNYKIGNQLMLKISVITMILLAIPAAIVYLGVIYCILKRVLLEIRFKVPKVSKTTLVVLFVILVVGVQIVITLSIYAAVALFVVLLVLIELKDDIDDGRYKKK